MACTKETVKSSGLNTWSGEHAPGSAPELDIIAVQGLDADPFYTWVKNCTGPDVVAPKGLSDKARFWRGKKTQSHSGKDGMIEVMWPRDLLVPLFKNARIATYGYKSDWKDRDVKTSLQQCAEQLLNVLFQYRQHEKERPRPLILIGHSLGCLVIQQALVIAVHQRDFIDIRLSIAGIIFLGAPFQGSEVAVFGKWFAQLSRLDSTLLKSLEKDSPFLHVLSRSFWGTYGDCDIVCFYENMDTDYGAWKSKIVSSQSASLPGKRMIFLNTNHSGLNKFGGMQDENFALLLPEIQRMARDGPSIVVDRHRRNTAEQIRGHVEATVNVHWMVPRIVNDLFTGRSELLDRIQDALRGDKASDANMQKRFIITGLGGQGKSEVCLKIANIMREEFWGVFWVDVSSPSIAESDFIAVAMTLGRSVKSGDEALHVLANTKQNWLLILDNADDPDFDYQEYFPSGAHGAVILTSRLAECSRYSTIGSEALVGLDIQFSRQLLLKATEIPQESWPSSYGQAKDVVCLLGSHTLALLQAGAYIANGHGRLDQYPEVYKRQRKRLLEYRPKQARSRYRDVYTTFEASADVLTRSPGEAAKDALCLLEVLSILHSNKIPVQIFEDAWHGARQVLRTANTESSGLDALSRWHVSQLPDFIGVDSNEWDAYRLVEASSLLVSLSLITRYTSTGLAGLSMHPLTHAWAKDRQGLDQQGPAWITAGCVLALSRSNTHTWQRQERHLRPHIHSYLDIKVQTAFSFRSVAKVIPVLLKCGWALLQMRDDLRLAYLLQDIFTELALDPTNPPNESLPLYDLMSRSLMNLGKAKEAVELLVQVIKVRDTLLAEDHPDRLGSQHALAIAYKANGQVKEAVELSEQVVKIKETTLAEDHPGRLASQHALAIAYKANGQVKEAVELLEQVVKIEETTLAEDHPDRLASQHALASAYEANGQVKEAVELLEQVVKIEETTLAEDHPDRLASQHALASAYQANGQVKEAVELLEQVVKIEETTLAEDHPDRLASQHALASAYQANGQVKEAVELLE